jgi:superfamily I DNA/RNA helicase
MLDYDDQILYAREVCAIPELVKEIRSQIHYCIVDEAQDTSEVEMAGIIERLFTSFRGVPYLDGGGRLTVVGDDDQAIYVWRGASPSLLQKRSGLHCLRFLTESHRCPLHVQQAALGLIARNKDRIEKPWKEEGPDAGAPRVRLVRVKEQLRHTSGFLVADDFREQARHVLEDVRLHSPLESHVVLVRTNKIIELFSQACRSLGGACDWPQLSTSDERKWQNKARQDLIRAILFKCREAGRDGRDGPPADPTSVPEVVLRISDDIFKEPVAGSREFSEVGPGWLICRFAERLEIPKPDADFVARKVRDLRSSVSCIPQLCAALHPHLQRPRGAVPLPDVDVRTVHAVKGLEWDYVYLFNATRDEWPLDVSRRDDRFPNPVVREEEERRVFYVGLTRARRDVMVTFDDRRGAGRFVEELAKSEWCECEGWPPTGGPTQFGSRSATHRLVPTDHAGRPAG